MVGDCKGYCNGEYECGPQPDQANDYVYRALETAEVMIASGQAWASSSSPMSNFVPSSMAMHRLTTADLSVAFGSRMEISEPGSK